MVSTAETLERTLANLSFYTGKIGIDNFFLIVVGILYFCVYYQNRQTPLADLHWRTAVFFLGYGFLYDLFRIKELRVYLLLHTRNFLLFRSLLLFLCLLFLYDGIFHVLFKQWKQKHWR